MRSWTAAVTAFGVVVKIEQDLTHCPLGSFERSHSPANANNFPALTSTAVRLLRFARPLPLVKSVCRNQAPAKSQCIAERGLPRRRFRSGVNHLGRTGRVFCPPGNE